MSGRSVGEHLLGVGQQRAMRRTRPRLRSGAIRHYTSDTSRPVFRRGTAWQKRTTRRTRKRIRRTRRRKTRRRKSSRWQSPSGDVIQHTPMTYVRSSTLIGPRTRCQVRFVRPQAVAGVEPDRAGRRGVGEGSVLPVCTGRFFTVVYCGDKDGVSEDDNQNQIGCSCNI